MKPLFACVFIVASLAACERQREAPAPTEAVQTASTLANTTTLELRIDGMVCGGCAEAAQQALERIDGVRSADVSFEKGLATVICEAGVSADELVTVLHNVEMSGQKMQFQASVVE